jgi:hypothetical protein
MTHTYHTCLRCSGTGKKPGLLDADQRRPRCIHCEGTGTIRIPEEPTAEQRLNKILIQASSILLWAKEDDPSWPDGPEQLDLFEVNQGDQPCAGTSIPNAGTTE